MEEGEKQRDRTLLHHRKRKKVTRSETRGGRGGIKKGFRGGINILEPTRQHREEERTGEKMEGGSQAALAHTHSMQETHKGTHTGASRGRGGDHGGWVGEEKTVPELLVRDTVPSELKAETLSWFTHRRIGCREPARYPAPERACHTGPRPDCYWPAPHTCSAHLQARSKVKQEQPGTAWGGWVGVRGMLGSIKSRLFQELEFK